MKKILITGIAGSGKSTVCQTLYEMGYETYGIEDIEGMFEMYHKGTDEVFKDYDNSDPNKIKQADWRCNSEKLKELLQTQKNDLAFYCGVATNMDELFPLFDQVILLKASSDNIYKRLSNREGTDDIGNTEASRKTVLGWKDWWEDEMTKKGVLVVDANNVPEAVTKTILTLCR